MEPGATGGNGALLSSYLLSERPGCIVLIVGQQIDIHWPDEAQLPPVLTFGSLSEYSDNDVVAPAVAVLQLEGQAEALDQWLGRAVRLFPERLIICADTQWPPDHRFFAFGFRRLDVVNSASCSADVRWFEYKLSTYKSSPDWLNARFWANPERFEDDDEYDAYPYDEEE